MKWNGMEWNGIQKEIDSS